MLKSVLLAFALAAAGFLLVAGCVSAPSIAKDPYRSEQPDAGEAEEAFLPVPRQLYDSDFPRGGLYRIPEDPRTAPLVKRAGVYEGRKQWQSARKAYALACTRAGSGAAAPYILFKRWVLDDDLDKSIAGLKELLERFPSFPLMDAARLELAGRLSMRKQYETALNVLDGVEGVEYAPYAAALSGELNFKLGRLEQSLDSYERARGYLAGSAAPSAGLFLIRCYLGISKTLIAGGDDAGRAGARELLRRIAGTPSHPYFQSEALALLRSVSPAGEERTPVSTPDEGLLKGSHWLGPDGKLHIAEWPLEAPGDRTAAGNNAGNYSFQVGSFGVSENAENMVKEITGKGFPAFLSEATVRGKPLFRVRVGPFEGLPEAQEAGKLLGAMGYSGFVVRER